MKYNVNWKERTDGLMIKVPTEFSFAQNLAYLQRDKNECMYEIKEKKITCVINALNDSSLIQISTPDNSHLFVRFLAGARPKSSEEKDDLVCYICEWFDLDRDLGLFYKMAQNDPLLKQVIKDFYGLRIIGIPDLFEALCWGILGQQINLKFAYLLKCQFVEKFGEAFLHNGKSYWIFPTYEKISKLKPQDLSDIKMTARKREFIIGIAKLMASGELSKENLLELVDYKKIEKELVKVQGIGPWTANYVLMRCLRYPMAFPINDVGLINSIKFLKGMDRKPTKKEILKMSTSWKNWEAYATFYLWRALY